MSLSLNTLRASINSAFLYLIGVSSLLKVQFFFLGRLKGFKEFGIFEQLVKNEMKDAHQCLVNIGQENTRRPLSLTDFFGVFSLLAAGDYFVHSFCSQ